MAWARTQAVTLVGVTGRMVEVEADLGAGLPTFTLGGLPDSACAQAPDRVRAALANSGMKLPSRRLVVNLSPADLRKRGTSFDVAIAVAALAAAGSVPAEAVARVVHIGELGLDGSVRPVPGILPAVLAARAAGAHRVVVPAVSAAQAALVPEIEVIAVDRIGDLVQDYRATGRPVGIPWHPLPTAPAPAALCLSEVAGQESAKSGLEVAAAGGHHLLLQGVPGSGKTMLAQRLPGLLPALSAEQALEVAAIRSLVDPRVSSSEARAPFEAPHHTATTAAIVGGGPGIPGPGAISRAHHGVLFLDEAPELRRQVIESLRQPMEEGRIALMRAGGAVELPARFQLVMAANPCPCGLGGRAGSQCDCSPNAKRHYIKRLSGPLLDRVDVQVTMDHEPAWLSDARPRETSAVVADRVAAARARQLQRWQGLPWQLNAHAPGAVFRSGEFAAPGVAMQPLEKAHRSGALSARAVDRILRVARTLADLADRGEVLERDVARAVSLRGVNV